MRYFIMNRSSIMLSLFKKKRTQRPPRTVNNTSSLTVNSLGEFNLALQKYNQDIKSNPLDIKNYVYRADHFYCLGRYREALEDYDRCIELNPQEPSYFNNRANCLLALDQFDSALQAYTQAIFLDKNNAKLYFNRGNCLLYFCQFNRTLDDYYQARALKYDDSLRLNNHIANAQKSREFLDIISEIDNPGKRKKLAEKNNQYQTYTLLKQADKINILKKSHSLDFNEALAYLDIAANSWLLLSPAIIKQKNFNPDLHLYLTSFLSGLSSTSIKKIINTLNERIYLGTLDVHLSHFKSGLFSAKTVLEKNEQIRENYLKRKI